MAPAACRPRSNGLVRACANRHAACVEDGEDHAAVYDRPAQDVGNSVHLEHVNVTIPSQHHATLFYVAGLGLTRDPYMMVSDDNMWVNVGRSQFHLPTGRPRCCADTPAS